VQDTPRCGASSLLVSGIPHSEVFEPADPLFRNRRSVSAFGVRVTTFIVSAEGAVARVAYCVDGNDVAAVMARCAMCGSVLHLVPLPSRDWCACGLADCVYID
jgi:hypothetical protein